MPVSYKDLKKKEYLDATRKFLDTELQIRFNHGNRAYCPFHHDTNDSLRMRISKQDEVRFHCFGSCQKDWDIYDLIMLKTGCTFRQAQERFAKFLGVENVEYHRGRIEYAYEEKQESEEGPEEPILETDTQDLTDRHRDALKEAAGFYNDLLMTEKDKFEKAWRYLRRRGVEQETIGRFGIGFCPSLEDEEFRGRALLSYHLNEFLKDHIRFQDYYRTSIFRLLDDETSPAYRYYRKHIDYGAKHPYGVYCDYFANRITFPILNIDGQIEGMVGRRLDNRGLRWLKQAHEDSILQTEGWLYGIDKSARGMKEYHTAIIVEGIFDFFAFYNVSENKERPIVISTLGTVIQPETVRLLHDLGVKNLIVAFDQDEGGRRGIQKAADGIKEMYVSFLGSLKEGEDPADGLKGVLGKLSNFAIRHLQKGMQVKHPTGKPISSSILVQRSSGKKVTTDYVLLKPASVIRDTPVEPSKKEKPKAFWYRIDNFINLLSYNRKNRAELKKTLEQIILVLSDPQKDRPTKENFSQFFHLPIKFIEDEHHIKLGGALILHLRLAIEQQTKKRKGGLGGKIKETDRTIAGWLNTTTRTIQNYKRQLKEAGLLDIEMNGITQELSVRFSPRTDTPVVMTRTV